MFTSKEKNYLHSQKLARLATTSPSKQPDVAPVGYNLEGDNFVIGSLDMERTLKYKNINSGNNKVSLVVDDLESVNPWKPRGIKVKGTAKLVEREDQFGTGTYIEVHPEKVWSWGIEGSTFKGGKVVMNVKRQGESGASTLELGKVNRK